MTSCCIVQKKSAIHNWSIRKPIKLGGPKAVGSLFILKFRRHDRGFDRCCAFDSLGPEIDQKITRIGPD